MIIDLVIDNNDNSLQITAHDDNGSYTTGMGRLSDMPNSKNFLDAANMAYFEQIVQANCLPSASVVVYQNPDYVPPSESNEADNTPPEE